MAEAILSAIFPVILEKLISPAIHQLAVAFGTNDQLQKLNRISVAFLRVIVDAEEKQTTDIAIKTWLAALKDVSYEAVDVLDDFEFEALRKQISLNEGNFGRKVHFYCSSYKTRFSLCRRLNHIIEKMDAIADEIRKFNFQPNKVLQTSSSRPQTISYVDKEEVIGREKDKEEIVSILINHDVSNNNKIIVLPIYAMGGMGKTTLSQLVFGDHRVEAYFHLRLWVCVADANFDVDRLVKLIIEADTNTKCDLTNMEQLQKKLREKISGQRYLIVLDDVWNENPNDWERLKTLLDCGGEGSSILVSTRNKKAAEMMATRPFYELEQLPEKDSWELFRRRAFAEEAEEPASLVEIGKDIIKRCVGLPLAIKTLGSMMRLKNDKEEWKAVLNSEIWEIQDAMDYILPALRLSYSYLPSHLKQCFAFCAIYPKDYEMEKETLIQLWMANGFIPFVGTGDLDAKGRDIFDELVWRSFFQDVVERDDGNVTCKTHNLMHDLAQLITEKECLKFENIQILKQDEINFQQNKMKSLRVLSCSSFIWSKKETIRHFKHLRMLDLSHSHIKKLPKGICSLYHLQTLKLNHCSFLEKLPDNLTDLMNLRHLHLDGCKRLVRMPKRMGSLIQLHTLTMYVVSDEAEMGIEQLRNLNLCGKIALYGLENVSNAADVEEIIFSSNKNLCFIELYWLSASSVGVFETLKPSNQIKSLKLWGYYGQQLPRWMNDLEPIQNLARIELAHFECRELPSLGRLPFLNFLGLYYIKGFKHFISKKTWCDREPHTALFPSLKSLFLRDLDNLEDWWEAEGTNALVLPDRQFFPCLRGLSITSCNKLSTIPTIPSLSKLILDRCSNLISPFSFTSQEGPEYAQLRGLVVKNCESLIHLPASLPFLLTLEINHCNSLESLPPGMEELYYLHISNCNGLMSLPEDLLNLGILILVSCNCLESLPEGMEGLTQLKYLIIEACDKLRSLPRGFLQHLPNLSLLGIIGSKELTRAFNDDGEYWHLIQNIPITYVERTDDRSDEEDGSEGCLMMKNCWTCQEKKTSQV